MDGSTPREPGRRRRSERLWLDAVETADDGLDWERAPRARRPRAVPSPAPSATPSPVPRATPSPVSGAGRAPAGRASVSRAWELQIASLAIGLLLGGLLALVALAGTRQFWLNVGGALVAFGLAFDLYARVIGTIAAREASETGWAIACAVGGSPVVAGHALMRRSGPAAPEMDTLAGLLALTLVLALLVASFAGSVRG